MPSAFIHSIIDLLAYGRPYFDLHKKKDAAYATIGVKHRKVYHEWYNVYLDEWDFDDPFPPSLKQMIEDVVQARGGDDAERDQSFASHDYFDRIWDSLSEEERQLTEEFFIWVLGQPKVLKQKFGVDVHGEKIERMINGQVVWEDAPGLRKEYRRLCAYADVVKGNTKRRRSGPLRS